MVKLEGRTPVLLYLADSEYNALAKHADEDKVSMTLIIRHLVEKYLLHNELGAAFSLPSLVKFAAEDVVPRKEEDKQAVVVHFSDEEYDELKDKYGESKKMTFFIRNLIRTKLMDLPPLEDDEEDE